MNAVQVIDAGALNDLKNMFVESQRMVRELATENAALKSKKLLSVAEVAEMTGYSTVTINRRKEEIGFFTEGKDIKFKPSDVDAWIEENYIKPKSRQR